MVGGFYTVRTLSVLSPGAQLALKPAPATSRYAYTAKLYTACDFDQMVKEWLRVAG